MRDTSEDPLVRLRTAWFVADAKYVHAIMPANAKSAYGIPSDGSLARRPKTSVKMIVSSAGCSEPGQRRKSIIVNNRRPAATPASAPQNLFFLGSIFTSPKTKK